MKRNRTLDLTRNRVAKHRLKNRLLNFLSDINIERNESVVHKAANIVDENEKLETTTEKNEIEENVMIDFEQWATSIDDSDEAASGIINNDEDEIASEVGESEQVANVGDGDEEADEGGESEELDTSIEEKDVEESVVADLQQWAI